MNKQVLIGLSTLSLVAILSGVALSSSNSSAASASTATATVKIATSCTLTSTGGGNYSATVPNGTSAEIEGSTLTASCNDAGGFALYAVGYSNDTIGNNNMIGPNVNIATNTSGNDSYWAMKINPTTGTTPTIENSFNDFHIVPNAHTKVASYSGSTGTGSLSVDATYKANISSTQLAGNYLGKVKYTLVHPSTEIMPHEIACAPRKICYNPNTVTVEGQMGKQSASNNASATLYAPNFKRDGYGFAGWNTAYDYSGTNYGPNQTITAPSDVSTNGLSLYAVWIKSAGTLQNWTGCSGLAQGAVTALTDNRDSDTYAVAKLADGKCWMIENLRLDNNPELSSANTHNPSLPLTNTWYYNASQTTLITSNHLSHPTQDSWCQDNSNSCYDQSMLSIENTTLFTNNISSNYDNRSDVYSYGNYYNWYSASVGHGTYNKNNGIVDGDICPAGWHLPTGKDATGEFGILDIALGGTGESAGPNTTPTGTIMSERWRSYPNNFVFSGISRGAPASYRNQAGYYWSASVSNTHGVYELLIDRYGEHKPGIWTSNKSQGEMVRCIAGT